MGAEIYVYTDESGTAPISDDEDLFVGAAVLMIGAPPANLPTATRLGPTQTARQLQKIGAEPRCFFVRPGVGYGDTLRKKHEALDLLTRGRVLMVGGENAVASLRNWVWAQVMSVAAEATLNTAITRTAIGDACQGGFLLPPDRVHFCFHRKSLRRPVQDVQRTILSRLTETIREVAPNTARLIKDKQARGNFIHWASYFSIEPNRVTVEWSHEHARDPETGEVNPHAGALCLVDSFVHNVFCEFRTTDPRPGFVRILSDHGFSYGVVNDFTANLLQPLARSAVEGWSRRTGLPIPRGLPLRDE